MSNEASNNTHEKETSQPSSATKEREHQKVETPVQIAKRKFEETRKKLFRIRGERQEKEQAVKEVEMGTNTEPGKTDKKQESQQDDGAKKEEEKALKETFDSLSEKHKTEVKEVLFSKKLKDIDVNARNIAHNELIYSLVPDEKKNAIRERFAKDESFQKLSQEDKDEKIQAQVLLDLGELPAELQKTLLVNLDSRGDTSVLSETLQKKFGISPEESVILLPKLLDEKSVRDILLKNVQENGMLLAGIDQKSPLGKELAGIISTNVGEYLSISPAQEGAADIENFKGLKDVLGGGYEDLLYSKEFILGNQHPLKKTRDIIAACYEDEVAQFPQVEPNDSPEKFQEYKQSVQKAFTDATGIDGNKAEKAIRRMSTQNVSPIIRFLADLLAPLGAMMDGKTGDFWRSYLANKKNDTTNEDSSQNENYEQYGSGSEGIEGLDPNSILGAANKYMGVNESKNGNLISQMHTSAGLKAGPSTPWCMSFVQHVLRKDMGYSSEQIGIGPSASAAAGHRIGRHTDTPQLGDIVLVRRNGGSGRHIAFFAGFDGDKVKLLGGNQGDSVSVSTYSKSAIVEYRTLQKTAASSPTKDGETPDNMAQKQTSGMDSFPDTVLGADKYPSREFLRKNGMTPENVPMGMRVNNPLNLKFTGSAVQRSLFSGVLGKSEHTDQGDPQIVFSSPDAGLTSGMNLLLYKQKNRNFRTIDDMIANVPNGWTQGGPNNSLGKNAAREIAQRVGIGVHDALDLNNPDMMKKFMQALIIQEHGNSGKVYFPLLEKSVSQIGAH